MNDPIAATAPAKKEGAKKDDSVEPPKFNAKEDYQVKEAVNYLKSFEFYQKLSKPQAG